jgi:Tfp pilus assembly protein PilP|tara:strand:+ start:361 stop:612 length:252 start_codon:yes stop_codon:yes gene_type:complete
MKRTLIISLVLLVLVGACGDRIEDFKQYEIEYEIYMEESKKETELQKIPEPKKPFGYDLWDEAKYSSVHLEPPIKTKYGKPIP